MTQPKLREGAEKLVEQQAETLVEGLMRAGFGIGVLWTLNNLHLLLEPRDQPLVNGKRVAIVEVEE